MAKMMSVSIKQFHLPIPATGPENSAPTAAPPVVKVCMSMILVTDSSSSQLFFLLYAAETAFHDPII